MTRIPSLDGFRAISILLVLICHSRLSAGFPTAYADLARHGKIGVTVFFVISGFLITSLLLTEEQKNGKIKLSAFYIKRAFRILPVFILYTAFVLLMKDSQGYTITNNDLLHVLTFTANFDPDNSWFLGHLWTLSVEEQFYLLWPVLLVFCRKYIKPILIILIAYGCIARVIDFKFPAYKVVSLSPFFMYADAILLGALGGVINAENRDFSRHKIFQYYPLQLLAFGIITLFVYLSGYGKMAYIALPFGGLFISVSIMFLIFAYVNPTPNLLYKLLNSKILIHIGVLSYSIYVWQQYFFVGKELVWYRVWPLNILVIYVISLASYYLCEQPFLRMRRYVLK